MAVCGRAALNASIVQGVKSPRRTASCAKLPGGTTLAKSSIQKVEPRISSSVSEGNDDKADKRLLTTARGKALSPKPKIRKFSNSVRK
mmetsp:Transcript_38205/g.57604  ORF Transcript_38205/g.57604 Transcript_38205/m.57604 type:complete len:88 (-) Transcript_38205:152-415(-)